MEWISHTGTYQYNTLLVFIINCLVRHFKTKHFTSHILFFNQFFLSGLLCSHNKFIFNSLSCLCGLELQQFSLQLFFRNLHIKLVREATAQNLLHINYRNTKLNYHHKIVVFCPEFGQMQVYASLAIALKSNFSSLKTCLFHHIQITIIYLKRGQ